MTDDSDDRALLRELVSSSSFVLATARFALSQQNDPYAALRDIARKLVDTLLDIGVDMATDAERLFAARASRVTRRAHTASAAAVLAWRADTHRRIGEGHRVTTLTDTICPRCGDSYTKESEDFGQLVCGDCRPLFPPSLLKATVDPFDYALRLRTGEEIRFNTAEIHGDYVTIGGMIEDGERPLDAEENPKLPHRFNRGLEVRVQDIVWCADAPDGS
jgi:hypothetical protein